MSPAGRDWIILIGVEPGDWAAAGRANIEAVTALSREQPVLLVCLRHLGCAFAREALADLQSHRTAIEASGVRLVIVHLEPPATAEPLLRRYRLDDVTAVSDPAATIYRWCGLPRARMAQLIAPRVIWRWLITAIVRRAGAGWTRADVRRMPGAFLIDNGRIVRGYRHRTTADRPDYVCLCSR